MLSFKELMLRNFLSFGNNETVVDLTTRGSTLIVGENIDTGSNNGAGKSTLLNAISFALYNKPLENISKERMINKTNHTKTTMMEVALTFTRDGKEYRIYRSRGASNDTKLTENGVDISPDSVDNINKKIVELAGISFDLFSRLIVFRGSDVPFLDLPVSAQRLTIEELFNITLLTEKAKLLKEKNKTTESDIIVLQALIKAQEQAKALHEKQLKEAEERITKWEMDKDASITKQTLEIQSFDSDEDLEAAKLKVKEVDDLSLGLAPIENEKKIISDKKMALLEKRAALTEENKIITASEKLPVEENQKQIANELKSISSGMQAYTLQRQEIIKQKNALEKEISVLEQSLVNLTKDKTKAAGELAHLTSSTGAHCPFCSQEIKDEAQLAMKIDEITATIAKTEDSIGATSTSILEKSAKNNLLSTAEVDQAIDEIQSAEKELKGQLEQLIFVQKAIEDKANARDAEMKVEINGEISRCDLETAALVVKIQELNNHIRDEKAKLKYKSENDILKSQLSTEQAKRKLIELQDSINPHTDAYESILLESVKEIEYEKLDILKKELEHQKFLLKLLTDNSSFVRRKIIQKTTPFLNTRINEYTLTLGLPHIVKFDTDMTASVSEYGRELDFGNLSSGEKKRVNLALSMAFRDVYHHMHEKIDILFLDEPDGGSMCTTGVDSLIRLLKKKSRDEKINTYVIMHRPECAGRFDNDMIIRKQGGFSSVVAGA